MKYLLTEYLKNRKVKNINEDKNTAGLNPEEIRVLKYFLNEYLNNRRDRAMNEDKDTDVLNQEEAEAQAEVTTTEAEPVAEAELADPDETE